MFNNDWDSLLKEEVEKPYFEQLRLKVAEEYRNYTVYPPQEDIFRALKQTPYKETKVVILGQDPYHGYGQAEGLSFSVKPGVKIPPSLHNIYKELTSDTGISTPSHGSLMHWANQGVLLLNAVLTVREGQPNSHKGLGWERFTDAIISKLNERETPMVFILWGSYAQKKGVYIDRSRHKVLESSHPSPLAARKGFFGSRPFSTSSIFLKEQGIETVNWDIPGIPVAEAK
ncbi:uracil-DNA glycosylase [Paenibacillus sp. N3/727]|uniref:uracil-DNA glycosylase n=1 Tax=Paenibacillus sp. N3/727 TaxID=2925845 RepID=UPI001F53A000|nr:uracil-DNA glycosylase [Paenibacillus sp. N3/727]UNK20145.1 uracil-DNA glycosylase [Paenibacillus sp. N3/727]